VTILVFCIAASGILASDWRQFRGPGGQGISDEKGLPVEWGTNKNIAWKIKLPGAGASCPVTLSNRVYVTCYSGYGMDTKMPGNQKDLKRHFVCVDRIQGKITWTKDFDPVLPEHNYSGEGSYHGYAASTPITDGERLYVFFGKSGVFCFDLDGKQIWHSPVGKGTSGWGSGASPILYKNLLIINASVEDNALVAFDKMTGKEVWRAKDFRQAWGTPILAPNPEQGTELVLSSQGRVTGVDPESGEELWFASFANSYICPSVVMNKDTIYAIGAGSQSVAIKTGGCGSVNKTHVLWRQNRGSNAGSPVYHDGHLYWASESGGVVHCQEVATGKPVYSERLPDAKRVWASPVFADGKLYYVSQDKGVYVVAARPKFELLARNVFTDDDSRSNASLAISDGHLFLRNDQYLYCIGKR
jgi:outer membrane protein assembly factor BamB